MNKVGYDNVLWFVGVVENIDRATGRVQVRCFGVHPTVVEDPTYDLPWATPINGTYGNMNFIPQVAEWVCGFFIDGRDAQQPLIIGTIPGANATLPSGSGDPAENQYVKPSREALDKFGTPALHPAITGEDATETPIVLAEIAKINGLETPDGSTINEPDPVLGGDPSHVSVITPGYAKSYIEVSGSEDSEHVSIMHTSGAHVQIDHSGNVKIKSMGNMFTGSESNSGEYVAGRKDVVIEGKYTIAVNGGDCVLKVAGDLTFDAGNDVNFNVSGKMNFNVAEAINMTGSKLSLHAREDNVDIYAASKMKLYSAGLTAIETGGSLFMKSATTDMISSGSFRLNSSDANINGGKVAVSGGTFYVDAGATFIDGNPSFNSGAASGQSASATSTSEIATPVEQEDIAPRSVVATAGAQDRVSGSPSTGSGRSSLDDVVDISADPSDTTGSPGGAYNESEVLRNVAVGRASALLELIGDAEANGDYNIVFSGTKIALPQPITTFTISELLDWQDRSVAAGSESSAAGKYQVIRKTLRSSVATLTDITMSSVFNSITQDTIAYHLLEIRGLSKYIAGKITREEFANSLAREWAGLPVVSGPKRGTSYYSNVGSNAATVSVSALLSAIDQIDKSGGIIV